MLAYISDITDAKYHYTRFPASMNNKGKTVAVYHVGPFYKRGALMIRAETSYKNDIRDDGERADNISVTWSTGSISRKKLTSIYTYLQNLSETDKQR